MTFKLQEIDRVRGDTKAIPYILTTDDTGLPVDIAGYSFLLSVDTQQNPPDSATQVFQVAGSIVDAPSGKLQFQLTELQADQTPDVYWYDVQVTEDTGAIVTLLKGKWRVRQDITK